EQALAHDQELAHRLRGLTRLGDHVERRAVRIDLVENGPEAARIDVVGDDQPSAALLRAGGGAVKRRTEAAVERASAEHRAADSEHHEGAALGLHLARQLEDRLYLTLLVGRVAEAHGFALALRIHRGVGAGHVLLERRELVLAQAALADEPLERS